MRIKEILESKHKRSEQNPRTKGHSPALDLLTSLPRGQLLKTGVTLTKIPYPKINPQYKDIGPVGIYFYPASYYVKEKSYNRELPLRDNSPYINVFTWNTDKILNLGSYDNNNFQLDLKKLYSVYNNNKVNQLINDIKSKQKYSDNQDIEYVSGDFSIGKVLWKLTEQLSTSKSNWNSILRKVLEYDLIIDNSGVIWWEETSQGIILNPSVITHIDVFQQPKISSYSKFQNKNLTADSSTLEKIINKKIPFKTLPAHLQFALLDVNNLEYGLRYAQNVVKQEWPPFEHVLLKKTKKHVKEPFVALAYLTSVRKTPWPELENILKSDPYSLSLYQNQLSKLL